MKWLQTRNIDGAYRRFVRFKCNRCGTTGELPDVAAPPGSPLPGGWQSGPHEGSHLCPGCVASPRKKLLPVLS